MSFRTLFSKGAKKRTYVVAEIGGNFTRYEQAVKLIDAASASGVDCVKLQTYRAQTLASKNAFFDMENTGKVSQYEYFRKFEISRDLHKKVFAYAGRAGLDWFSTPSHYSDVDMLESLGAKAYKIGADDAVNMPLLRYIAKKGKPVFLSTGMCTLKEIEESVKAIRSEGNDEIVIFHTVSIYPTYPQDVNLNAIKTLTRIFEGIPIGYSDHTTSPLACIAAVAMGARVIERHFTLDKFAKGPDHMLSSTPAEMKYIVESARAIEAMMGDGAKIPSGAEIINRKNNRKSIVAVKDIKKGGVFSDDNISFKRPGTGLEPRHYYDIIGKSAARDIRVDELIAWKDVGRLAR